MDWARRGLAGLLELLIEDGDVIPVPSPIESLRYGDDPEGGTYAVALVDVVLTLYRSQKTEYARVNCNYSKLAIKGCRVEQC